MLLSSQLLTPSDMFGGILYLFPNMNVRFLKGRTFAFFVPIPQCLLHSRSSVNAVLVDDGPWHKPHLLTGPLAHAVCLSDRLLLDLTMSMMDGSLSPSPGLGGPLFLSGLLMPYLKRDSPVSSQGIVWIG